MGNPKQNQSILSNFSEKSLQYILRVYKYYVYIIQLIELSINYAESTGLKKIRCCY